MGTFAVHVVLGLHDTRDINLTETYDGLMLIVQAVPAAFDPFADFAFEGAEPEPMVPEPEMA